MLICAPLSIWNTPMVSAAQIMSYTSGCSAGTARRGPGEAGRRFPDPKQLPRHPRRGVEARLAQPPGQVLLASLVVMVHPLGQPVDAVDRQAQSFADVAHRRALAVGNDLGGHAG